MLTSIFVTRKGVPIGKSWCMDGRRLRWLTTITMDHAGEASCKVAGATANIEHLAPRVQMLR